MHRRSTHPAILIGLLATAIACDAEPDEEADTADPSAVALMAPPTELMHFDDLAGMTARSTAVVEGEVLAVAPGRRVGNERDWIELDEATVRVERVLAGTMPTSSFLLEMEGRDRDGRPLVHSIGLEPNRPGDRGVYFLWLKSDATPEPRYRLITTQGRFLEIDDQTLAASRTDDPLASRLAALGPANLETAILAAAAPR
jgi:hypothetical protein